MASAAPVGAVRCNARPHHSSLNHPRSLLYYLTTDWSVSDGGLFVDMESGTEYIPTFNMALIFRVPRVHRVTPVIVDKSRYSIFGWWLTEGTRYDLEVRWHSQSPLLHCGHFRKPKAEQSAKGKAEGPMQSESCC